MANKTAPSHRVLVDSNIYIGLLRRKIDPVTILGQWILDGDLMTCGMIRLEVERGLKFSQVRQHLTGFFDVMINCSITQKLWKESAELAWRMDRSGIMLPAPDLLIATVAVYHQANILSDDSHFDDIPGVERIRPECLLADW